MLPWLSVKGKIAPKVGAISSTSSYRYLSEKLRLQFFSTVTKLMAPKVVFVLGGPGAGKGTQCALIEKHLGFKHISAGDCLREERNNPTSEVGDLINHYIKEGMIVPVEITCSLLRKKMEHYGWEDGRYLIDGFPRNYDNLEGWNKTMSDVFVQFCLFLDCPEEEMENRLLKRGEHSGRVDDNAESIRKRFNTYMNETMPIVKHFGSLNKCITVNGCDPVENVWENVQKAFAGTSCDIRN